MSTRLIKIQELLGKPYRDLEYLLLCFKEVLIENNEEKIAGQIPWLSAVSPDFSDQNQQKLLHLYSICFQLLNLSEVNGAVQNRRRKQEEKGLESVNGLWGSVFTALKQQGVNEAILLDHFNRIEVEPVLTAHPTEAKRPVVLSLYRDLYLLLVKLENSMYNSYERAQVKHDIKRNLHKLWFIGEIFIEKPAIESELENVLHYFYKVFPRVLPFLDFRLKQAWNESGFDPDLIEDTSLYPSITFGNWVGGDRDGHPLVTSAVTEYTLKELRLHAFKLIISMLDDLAEKLSIYVDEDVLPKPFIRRLQSLDTELNPGFENDQYEPFKHFIKLLKINLPVVERSGGGIDLHDTSSSYRTSGELVQDLNLMKSALMDYGAWSLASYDVQKVLRHLQIFGFHLAHLDVRQNSQVYEEALIELIRTSAPEDFASIKKNREQLNLLIIKELNHSRPFLSRTEYMKSDQAMEAVNTFKSLAGHVAVYSERALGSLIVSMTRRVTDLFTVYLFVREAGLSRLSADGLVCPMPVVPLFETIEDLKNSPEILDAFLSHPVTQNSLEYVRAQREWSQPVQDVMIGYSDSNKDGGILASMWYLHEAQVKLSAIGDKHKVNIRFFHGKGGTISRGAGPTHWFLKALPEGSLNGHIRVTEQGETIERKYANIGNAAYNLELLLAGATLSTVKRSFNPKGHDLAYRALFTYMAEESFKAFKKLTEHPSFIRFYEQATPIDVIESSKIGSRPSRRRGRKSLEDLRAIPWVFSWTQSRMHISSWYGVGTTFSSMKEEKAEAYGLLKELAKTDTYVRYVLTNIDTSLAATDEKIMTMYAGMVEDRDVRENILSMLLNELALTRRMMLDLLGSPISERRKNHHYSTLLRADALYPLHLEQVTLLKRWREVQKSDSKESKSEAESLLKNLLRSVNAIANAMGTTG